MNKTFCDRCKKDISHLKSYGVISLDIKDLKEYALDNEKGIEYHKTICPECATDIMNIVDFECDRYNLKTYVEEDKPNE